MRLLRAAAAKKTGVHFPLFSLSDVFNTVGRCGGVAKVFYKTSRIYYNLRIKLFGRLYDLFTRADFHFLVPIVVLNAHMLISFSVYMIGNLFLPTERKNRTTTKPISLVV